MEWMATITGDHVGYPGLQDLGDFFSKEKNLGEQKFARLLASNFHCRIYKCVLYSAVPVSVVRSDHF
jgi:hypothetical protein